MERRHLQENRLHGTPLFPIAAYRIERWPGEPILDNHWHEEAEFLWITEGRAVFQIGLSTYELQSGDGIFIPSGEVHGGYTQDGAGCTYTAVVFHMDWLTEAKDGGASQFLQPLQRGTAAIPALFGKDTEWGRFTLAHLEKIFRLTESVDVAKELRVKSELLLLFADLITHGQWTHKPIDSAASAYAANRLKAVTTYVEQHCGERLDVPSLATIAGMSIGHFSRMFKAYMRKTPIDYVNHIRIQRAAYLLQNTERSVADIALEVGMDNFSYFSKRFRTVFAVSPSQFRQKIKEPLR